jgi:myo-inositol-1(or 4)-monophosphatase
MKNVLLKAVTEAGKILRENFGGNYNISSKDIVSNLVTEIDHKSEQKIVEILKQECPSHCIIAEECGELFQESEYKWIIDPIDGTINYAHNIPISCISIGLEKNGDIIMGSVYNPMMEELFFAEKNAGAFLNEKPIKVSETENINRSLLVTGFPYDITKYKQNPVTVFNKFILMDIPVRRLGSAALDICWTACGRFDGFWEFNLNAWDTAAGVIILKEAGGKISDFDGKQYSVYGKQILATNGKIHEQMLDVINS